MRRPLEGIKVLDLTHGVAGPYCTMVLGDLGAEIVKIKKPERGDATRYMNVSEKFQTDIPRVGGDYFLAVNRNKRSSVAVEMKAPEGGKVCEELAGWADVVVQNFRPGVTQRLGLDYESLKVPYQAFPTRDGYVVVATGTNKTYRTLCDTLRRPDLARDVRFASNQSRVANRSAMVAELSAVFREQTTAQWLDTLEGADIPCAPVNELAEAYEELKTTAPDMVQRIAHPVLGSLSQLGVPFKFAACGGDIRRPPPMLGEHTDEVLSELLGRSAHDIGKLHASGVI